MQEFRAGSTVVQTKNLIVTAKIVQKCTYKSSHLKPRTRYREKFVSFQKRLFSKLHFLNPINFLLHDHLKDVFNHQYKLIFSTFYV